MDHGGKTWNLKKTWSVYLLKRDLCRGTFYPLLVVIGLTIQRFQCEISTRIIQSRGLLLVKGDVQIKQTTTWKGSSTKILGAKDQTSSKVTLNGSFSRSFGSERLLAYLLIHKQTVASIQIWLHIMVKLLQNTVFAKKCFAS